MERTDLEVCRAASQSMGRHTAALAVIITGNPKIEEWSPPPACHAALETAALFGRKSKGTVGTFIYRISIHGFTYPWSEKY